MLKTGYKGFQPFVPIEDNFDLRFEDKFTGIKKMIDVRSKTKLIRKSPNKRDRSIDEI
jgi:hypothetical protein